MNQERFDSLLDLYFEGTLGKADKQEFESVLRAEEEARRAFWKAVEWHALFRQWGEETNGRQDAESMLQSAQQAPASAHAITVEGAQQPHSRQRSLRLAALVAVAVFAATGVVLGPWWFSRPVALVSQEANAVWGQSGQVPEPGHALEKGLLKLERGAAVIAMTQGATVVVESPAELRLSGPNHITLHQGRIRVRVPERAHGFTVTTPEFTVVDLGTEFGCQVNPDGAGEVHVMEGKVTVQTHAHPAGRQTLHVYQASRISHGTLAAIPSEPARFLGQEDFHLQQRNRQSGRLASWRTASQEASQHPATRLHLDFETGSDTKILNKAKAGLAAPEAVIHGCKWTEGRWPGKGALEFREPGDRLLLSAPGATEAMTLVAWIKPAESKSRQHLLAPAGDYRAGEVDWIINPDGSWAIGVHLQTDRDPARGWRVTLAPNSLSLGRWHMLTAVLDTRARQASLYQDGQLVAAGVLEARALLQLGDVEVGNSERYRNLSPAFRGTLDELTVYHTAFTAGEVHQLFESGQP